jgi:uncharacterized protein (UPF0332 family)
MKLSKIEREEVVKYRLERAYKTLAEAVSNVENCCWYAAANRLYYACFYAVCALLINNGYTTRTHNGVFSLLGEHFVSIGLISKEQNKFYRRVLELRQTGDYDDFVELTEKEVLILIEPAKQFIETIEKLINEAL